MSDAPTKTLTTAEHEARLEKGWRWLKKYPGRRDWEDNFERWLTWLREYTAHEKAMQAGRQAGLFDGAE